MSDIPTGNPSQPQDDLYKYYDQPQVPARVDQPPPTPFHQEVYTNPSNGTIHVERGRGDGALNIYITNENININGRPSDQCVPRADIGPNYSQYCAPYRTYPVDYYNYPYRPAPEISLSFGPRPFFGPDRFHDWDRRHDWDRFHDRDRYPIMPVAQPYISASYYSGAPYYASPAPYYAGAAPYYAGSAPYYAPPGNVGIGVSYGRRGLGISGFGTFNL